MATSETRGADQNRAEELFRQMREGDWPDEPESVLALLEGAVAEAERRREGAVDVDVVKRAVRMLRSSGSV